MKEDSFDPEIATWPELRETCVGEFWKIAADFRITALVAMALLDAFVGLAAETNAPAPPPGWLTQPVSLVDALSRALRSNSDILKGRSDLEAAHGLVVQTRAIAMPKLRGMSGRTLPWLSRVTPFNSSDTKVKAMLSVL